MPSYSSLQNRRRPYVYQFWIFFQVLRPYQRVHKGHLDGYLLHRTCVFNALRLFFLPNFPGPTFIPCPTFIPEARVATYIFYIAGIYYQKPNPNVHSMQATNVKLLQSRALVLRAHLVTYVSRFTRDVSSFYDCPSGAFTLALLPQIQDSTTVYRLDSNILESVGCFSELV